MADNPKSASKGGLGQPAAPPMPAAPSPAVAPLPAATPLPNALAGLTSHPAAAADAAPPIEVAAAPALATPLPPELLQFLQGIEGWAKANERDARNDTIQFWMFKAPAILSSALAGALALGDVKIPAAVLAGVASACVVIDAVNPRGQLRNAHLRALHDLRNLEHSVVDKWNIASLGGKATREAAAEIMAQAVARREKIAAAVKAAETAFAKTVDDD